VRPDDDRALAEEAAELDQMPLGVSAWALSSVSNISRSIQ
jgi:hypothetical protein